MAEKRPPPAGKAFGGGWRVRLRLKSHKIIQTKSVWSEWPRLGKTVNNACSLGYVSVFSRTRPEGHWGFVCRHPKRSCRVSVQEWPPHHISCETLVTSRSPGRSALGQEAQTRKDDSDSRLSLQKEVGWTLPTSFFPPPLASHPVLLACKPATFGPKGKQPWTPSGKNNKCNRAH